MKLVAAWNRYWFRPFPLIYLAIARIAAVGYQCFWLANGHYLFELRRLSRLPDALYDPIPLLHILLVPFGWHVRPSIEILEIVYVVTLIAGGFALAGLLTNLSLTIFAVGNLLLQGYLYSFHDIHHGQTAMMIFLTLLVLSPAGRSLSLDQLIKKRRLMARSRFCLWPLLVMHWIFAFIYLSAAKGKLVGKGLEWMNGHTLQFYFFEYHLRKDIPVAEWFGQQHWLAVILSWLSIFFETTFWLILLVPKLVMLYAPMGLLFHLGVSITLKANFYSFMVLYVVFLPWIAFKPRSLPSMKWGIDSDKMRNL